MTDEELIAGMLKVYHTGPDASMAAVLAYVREHDPARVAALDVCRRLIGAHNHDNLTWRLSGLHEAEALALAAVSASRQNCRCEKGLNP